MVFVDEVRPLPFFFATQLAGRVLIAVVDDVELPREDVDPVAHKQIPLVQVAVFGPAQENPLVLHVKLS